MIEVSLTTEASNFKDAWLKLLPKLWQYVKTDCPELSDDFSEDVDLDELDDG